MVGKGDFVIVDYGLGNLRSVANALNYLGCNVLISRDIRDLVSSAAIVLPGVGAFEEAMNNLDELKLADILRQQVIEEKKPFLGICLGMQLLAESSEENGYHQGLGFIRASVRKIPVEKPLRLPHIGWNDIEIINRDPLFLRLEGDTNFYFVHSYFLDCDASYISSYCQYGARVTASIQKDNIFA
ncbi:MAG: imidazole glycerol phosphate synthase subunit HisH, partial [Candidatus Omnitrophica bacterium]|nr:imidazole glycerol phosphate synthase subunit HisH [Candidatus Omnitrophota bacterium]